MNGNGHLHQKCLGALFGIFTRAVVDCNNQSSGVHLFHHTNSRGVWPACLPVQKLFHPPGTNQIFPTGAICVLWQKHNYFELWICLQQNQRHQGALIICWLIGRRSPCKWSEFQRMQGNGILRTLSPFLCHLDVLALSFTKKCTPQDCPTEAWSPPPFTVLVSVLAWWCTILNLTMGQSFKNWVAKSWPSIWRKPNSQDIVSCAFWMSRRKNMEVWACWMFCCQQGLTNISLNWNDQAMKGTLVKQSSRLLMVCLVNHMVGCTLWSLLSQDEKKQAFLSFFLENQWKRSAFLRAAWKRSLRKLETCLC